MRLGGPMALAAAGAAAAGLVLAGARRATERDGVPALRWARSNFRGRTVNLAGGPAVAAAATLAAAAGAGSPAGAAAAVAAGLGAGSVGLYDDLVGARPEQQAKGFHGHLAALRRGRLTSGMVKLLGVGAAGVVAAALLHDRSPRDPAERAPGTDASPGGVGVTTGLIEVALGAGVVAGAANLMNLLDLRPGRALKVALLAGGPLATGPAGGLAAGPVGAAAAALPADLREQTMLGDCGANSLGALLGTALIARTGVTGRAVALAVIAGLTGVSEKVSFTRVIAATPGLRELDALGRQGEGPPPGSTTAPGG